MNEGANCFAPEIIQAGFPMFPCRVRRGTGKLGKPHQNGGTIFDEGKLGSKLLCSRDHSGGFWDVAAPSWIGNPKTRE